MLNNIRKYGPIALIIALAGCVRVYALLHVGDFTWDELFNFVFSQKNWSESLRIWQLETNPPLHLLLLKLWWIMAPTTELWARIPSILFGLASVYSVYLLGKKMFSHNTGLLAALIATISAPHIYISVLARVYGALFFFTTLSLYYFYQIFVEKKQNRRIIIGYIFIQIFLLFSHLTAVEVVAVQFFVLIILRSPHQQYWQWLKLNLLPVGMWVCWTAPSLITKFSNPSIGQAWFFNMTSSGVGTRNIALIFFGSPWQTANTAGLIIFGLVLVLRIAKNIMWKKPFTPALKTSLTYLTATIGIVCAYQLWNYKFFIILLPILFILLAYLVTQSKHWLAIALAIIILSLHLSGTVVWLQSLPTSEWDSTNQIASEIYRPDKKQTILVSYFVDKLGFDKYYHSPMTAEFFTPFAPQLIEEQILKNNYNYRGYTFTPEYADRWYQIEQLDQMDDILLFGWEMTNDKLSPTLTKNGWKLLQSYNIGVSTEHRLVHYVKDISNKK